MTTNDTTTTTCTPTTDRVYDPIIFDNGYATRTFTVLDLLEWQRMPLDQAQMGHKLLMEGLKKTLWDRPYDGIVSSYVRWETACAVSEIGSLPSQWEVMWYDLQEHGQVHTPIGRWREFMRRIGDGRMVFSPEEAEYIGQNQYLLERHYGHTWAAIRNVYHYGGSPACIADTYDKIKWGSLIDQDHLNGMYSQFVEIIPALVVYATVREGYGGGDSYLLDLTKEESLDKNKQFGGPLVIAFASGFIEGVLARGENVLLLGRDTDVVWELLKRRLGGRNGRRELYHPSGAWVRYAVIPRSLTTELSWDQLSEQVKAKLDAHLREACDGKPHVVVDSGLTGSIPAWLQAREYLDHVHAMFMHTNCPGWKSWGYLSAMMDGHQDSLPDAMNGIQIVEAVEHRPHRHEKLIWDHGKGKIVQRNRNVGNVDEDPAKWSEWLNFNLTLGKKFAGRINQIIEMGRRAGEQVEFRFDRSGAVKWDEALKTIQFLSETISVEKVINKAKKVIYIGKISQVVKYHLSQAAAEKHSKNLKKCWEVLSQEGHVFTGTVEQMCGQWTLHEKAPGQTVRHWLKDLKSNLAAPQYEDKDASQELVWKLFRLEREMQHQGLYVGDLHGDNLMIYHSPWNTTTVWIVDCGRTRKKSPAEIAKKLDHKWREFNWQLTRIWARMNQRYGGCAAISLGLLTGQLKSLEDIKVALGKLHDSYWYLQEWDQILRQAQEDIAERTRVLTDPEPEPMPGPNDEEEHPHKHFDGFQDEPMEVLPQKEDDEQPF